MSGEATNERVSRARALRLAAVGAAGAAAVMLADTASADAAVDTNYIAQNNGSSDLATGFISIKGSGGHGYTTGGQFLGTSEGVFASSDTGNGVIGTSGGDPGDLGAGIKAFNTGKGDGVWASAGADGGRGVYGEHFADGDGVSDGLGAGVHGVGNGGSAVRAEDASGADTASGVLATSSAGTGVSATTDTGTAVEARVTTSVGTALLVSGRAAYSNCGVATVLGSAGLPRQAVTVKNVALTANSMVVATLQANIAGVFVASPVPHVATGTVTINLNQPVSQHVKVGWVVCDLIPAV